MTWRQRVVERACREVEIDQREGHRVSGVTQRQIHRDRDHGAGHGGTVTTGFGDVTHLHRDRGQQIRHLADPARACRLIHRRRRQHEIVHDPGARHPPGAGMAGKRPLPPRRRELFGRRPQRGTIDVEHGEPGTDQEPVKRPECLIVTIDDQVTKSRRRHPVGQAVMHPHHDVLHTGVPVGQQRHIPQTPAGPRGGQHLAHVKPHITVAGHLHFTHPDRGRVVDLRLDQRCPQPTPLKAHLEDLTLGHPLEHPPPQLLDRHLPIRTGSQPQHKTKMQRTFTGLDMQHVHVQHRQKPRTPQLTHANPFHHTHPRNRHRITIQPTQHHSRIDAHEFVGDSRIADK